MRRDDKTPPPPSKDGIRRVPESELNVRNISDLDIIRLEDPISRETDPEGLLRPLEKPEES